MNAGEKEKKKKSTESKETSKASKVYEMKADSIIKLLSATPSHIFDYLT